MYYENTSPILLMHFKCVSNFAVQKMKKILQTNFIISSFVASEFCQA